MMASLFLLAVLVLWLVWRNQPTPSRWLWATLLLLGIALFLHHVTDPLDIDL